MTDAERLVWAALRNRGLAAKFRRQHPIGPYVVDFACLESRVVIEVDGGQHQGDRRDVRRTAFLQAQGFRVLRFWNNEVLQQSTAVRAAIHAALAACPHPSPLPQAGEGVGRPT